VRNGQIKEALNTPSQAWRKGFNEKRVF
jgi:hypothetical protein